ncbi:hypothetical protein Q8G40_29215, partial [Klebsiella pneumoniae]
RAFAGSRGKHLKYAAHPPKPPLLELEWELEEELNPLDLPPMLPDEDDVPLRVIDPVEVDVFGRTVEPTTGLFWNVPLV